MGVNHFALIQHYIPARAVAAKADVCVPLLSGWIPPPPVAISASVSRLLASHRQATDIC